MCLAKLVAGVAGAAYLGDVLKEADTLGMAAILTFSAESSLVKKSQTRINWVGGAGDDSSGEENE